jgi:hypothetical protein
VLLIVGLGTVPSAHASGATPYLPLNLSPEIERKIERVLILAGQPVLTRPVPVARVLRALPKARRRDPALCAEVDRYLDRYFGSSGVTHASLEVAAATHSTMTLPDERGERVDSPWDASAQAYYRPFDHLLLSGGVVGYGSTDSRGNPAGTLLSLGDQYAQLDLGWRDQWLSPATDSSLLMSTEAPTMPSVTLSNEEPIGGLGFQYELFVARMSYTQDITWQDGYTAGYPRLTGLHLSIEPVAGWAISANSLWQFGGGARPGSFSDFIHDIFSRTVLSDASGSATDSRFANRTVSITSAYTWSGPTPLETYVEYAGRDTLHGELYRFHETALTAGLHIPELFKRFDLTIEASEWQNFWYTDYVWQEGMTVNGYVTGNWGADWRTFDNDIGAQSMMVQLGWPLQSGDEINMRYRTLQNQDYPAAGPGQSYGVIDYRRAHMLTLEYAQPRAGYTRGLQLDVGRDVYGGDYARLAAFVRLDGGNRHDAAAAAEGDYSGDSQDDEAAANSGFSRFVDVGFSGGRLGLDYGGFTSAEEAAPLRYRDVLSPHLGLGVRHQVTANGDLGVRAEFDDFHGDMLALRVLDYRYRLARHLAIGAFFGFARYSAPTPAQGYYAGAGIQWRDLWPKWDLSFDARYFDRLQRDKLLPSDPQNGDPVEWYTMLAPSLYLSRRF